MNANQSVKPNNRSLITCVRKLVILAAIGSMMIQSVQRVSAQTFDAALQFDKDNNPSHFGPWQYGWSNSLGSSDFTLSPFNGSGGGFDYWFRNGNPYPQDYPTLRKNSTANPINFYNGGDPNLGVNGTIYPGQIAVEPGISGEIMTIRFTAPYTSTYSLIGNFESLQQQGLRGPSVNVHVLLNHTPIYNGGIYSAYGTSNYSTSLFLTNGDTVDFGVDYGNNGNVDSDITRIDARLTAAVPEMTSFGTWAIGSLLTLILAARRRLRS